MQPSSSGFGTKTKKYVNGTIHMHVRNDTKSNHINLNICSAKVSCFHGYRSVYHSPNPGRVCRSHLLSGWLQGNLKQLARCQAKEIWG